MREELSRRKNVARYRENPFWKGAYEEIGYERLSIARQNRISANGVNNENFYAGVIQATFEFKKTTLRVLRYIMNRMQGNPKADSVYIAWVEVRRYLAEKDLVISQSSYMRAMGQLLEGAFIAESAEVNRYWINPVIIFNDDHVDIAEKIHRLSAKNIIDFNSGDEIDFHVQKNLL